MLGYIITEKKTELPEIELACRREGVDIELRTADGIFLEAFEGSLMLRRPDIAVMLCDSLEACTLLKKLGVRVINSGAMDMTARERLYMRLMNTGLCIPRSLVLTGNDGIDKLDIQYPCMLAWDGKLGITENVSELKKACASSGKKLVFEKINGERFNCFIVGNALISQNIPTIVAETALRTAASAGLEYGCVTLIKSNGDVFVDSVSFSCEPDNCEKQQAAETLAHYISEKIGQ